MAMTHLNDEQLQEFLDGGRQAPGERLAQHLDGCPECRLKVAEYRAMYRQLTDDTGFDLPADFAASVMRRVELAPRRNPWLWVVYPAAAMVAVVAALYFFVDLSGTFGRLGQTISSITGMENAVVNSLNGFLEGLNLKPSLVLAAGGMLAAFALLERLFFSLRRGKAMFFA